MSFSLGFKKSNESSIILFLILFGILFQIFSALAVIQTKYPGFRHNDMKANNVLIQKIESRNIIRIGKK